MDASSKNIKLEMQKSVQVLKTNISDTITMRG